MRLLNGGCAPACFVAMPDRPHPVHEPEPESEPAPEEKPGSGPGPFTFTGSAIRVVLGRLALASAALLASAGCVSAPKIVMVDRATALEQQAAGSYDELERRLEQAAVAPRPVPLSPDELDALGVKQLRLVDDTETTDADRLDALLRQHCIGEGRDGLLVDTREACRARRQELAGPMELVDRVNRARGQLWRWMQRERGDASPDALRRAWRKAHLRGVPCGGWIQRDDGGWEEKGC